MASFGPKGSKVDPDFESDRFREMRERMNRDRDAFFQDSPSSFFGRESPFFRSRPGFEDFRSASPQFSGFPSDNPTMDSRKFSAPQTSSNAESIPIRVIHEPRNDKHRYGTAKTTDIPLRNARTVDPPTSTSSNSAAESPRVTRAHSEPPKTFTQRPSGMKTKIPLGNLPEHMEHNLSTSASDPSVPGQSNIGPATNPAESRENSATPANVRHIPIFVEGRDKPVINKDTTTTSETNTTPVPPPKRPTDFNKKVTLNPKHPNPKMEEPTSPLSPIPSDQPIPMGYTEPTTTTNNANINGAEAESPQVTLPSGPIPMPCSADYLQKTSSQQDIPPPNNTETDCGATKTKDIENDPCLKKLAEIQADVRKLVEQLEKFKGNKDSKEYKYLDEMLTRNLLKLDGLNLEGRDDVRQDRKQSIKDINRYLSILESKASGNFSEDQASINNEILSDLASNPQK